jgi:hypothetical protein
MLRDNTPCLIPKSKKELANEFQLHRHTITQMCEQINIYTRKKLSIQELRTFYHHYGVPTKEFAAL